MPGPTSPALPRLIGHRGAMAHAPENTLAGIDMAASLGVTMVEFDAKLTGDNVPVIMHDETVDRTTDGSGAVADMDHADIARLDAGSWFDPRFKGEPVPRLDDMLRRCRARGLAVNIEIKPCEGRTEATAEKVIETALAEWPSDAAPPLISSFRWDALLVAAELAPHWPRGLLIDDRPEDWEDWLGPIAPATLNVGWRKLSDGEMADYRATGLPVLVYTVNEADRARRLFAAGARSLITDAPDRLAPAVAALAD
ncbi:MAG: glycerophosphodiester phosphodiesterase [Azospirillaceae bacterium]